MKWGMATPGGGKCASTRGLLMGARFYSAPGAASLGIGIGIAIGIRNDDTDTDTDYGHDLPEHVLCHEPDVGRALGETAHVPGEPVLPVADEAADTNFHPAQLMLAR